MSRVASEGSDFLGHCKYLTSLWAGIPFVGDLVSDLCALSIHDPVYKSVNFSSWQSIFDKTRGSNAGGTAN